VENPETGYEGIANEDQLATHEEDTRYNSRCEESKKVTLRGSQAKRHPEISDGNVDELYVGFME